MNKDKVSDVWTIIAGIGGIVAAILFTSRIRVQLGWPGWLVFILVLVVSALVFVLPVTLSTVFSIVKIKGSALSQYGKQHGMRDLSGFTGFQFFLYVMAFVIVPIIIFIWLISISF